MTNEEAIKVLEEMYDIYDTMHEETDGDYGFWEMQAIDIAIEALSSADRDGHWMPFEKVADMLSWMFGKCACDVNDNDDWLPFMCKYADTECPHPKEENGCWMQFLMQGGVDMRGGDSE